MPLAAIYPNRANVQPPGTLRPPRLRHTPPPFAYYPRVQAERTVPYQRVVVVVVNVCGALRVDPGGKGTDGVYISPVRYTRWNNHSFS